MLNLFLCCAPGDRAIAQTLARRLEGGAECRITLEELGPAVGSTVAEAWDGGVGNDAILLLLSKEAVPERASRSDWAALLAHVESNEDPPVACVIVEDCPHPAILERRRFFRWSEDPLEMLRALERWVVSLHPRDAATPFSLAPLPGFSGQDEELEKLRHALVDCRGTTVIGGKAAGSGKTWLAHEFARRHGAHFRDVLWINCGDRPSSMIAGEIAWQLGIAAEGTPESLLATVGVTVRSHRVLVVLDDVRGPAPFDAPPEGLGSLLITTRISGPCLVDLKARKDAKRAPLMEEEAERLWRAISLCRGDGFSLELAGRVAGLPGPVALESAGWLVKQGLLDSLDSGGTVFRLAGGVSLQPEEALRWRHAEALNEFFLDWRDQPLLVRKMIAELEAALNWAVLQDWAVAVQLTRRAFLFLSSERRRMESALLMNRLLGIARERRDQQVVKDCEWELSWFQDGRGDIYRPAEGGEQMSLF
ncbi:TIR domain-containing protein [Paludibaculum fermentans]|uniref:TIR domain-containing protein n=1 Tax=Paludibaculum fermentans TaxID=1473598 RepID=A0A7S7NYK9_PALFE|nr:TIR domain-containing protein [Paludibaculum fermentans]QOY91604.1 TIR domain-containing protein [Paludibaculum fermentans]